MAGTFVIEVDWNNDLDFSDSNEDITSDVLQGECIRGRDSASNIVGRSTAGQLRVELLNTSGKYSSFNSSSPIYGSNLPGRRVRLRSTAPTAAVLWTGFLDRIEPHVERKRLPTATLFASGALIRLADPNTKVSPAALASVQTGDVIDAILDEVDWPAGDRNIDTGEVPIARWYTPSRGALELMREMEEAEQGFIFEDLDFGITFESRYSRLINRATSQATFSDANGASLPYVAIDQQDPLREIFNSITATVQPYTLQSVADLWTLSAVPFTLSPGASVTYIAQYTDAYVDAWTTPVVGTDIIQDGVSDGDIDVAVVKTATKMFITLTNDHATLTATITAAKARGTAVTADDPYLVSAADATSQGKYGLRTYPLPSPWFSNAAYAQAGCDYFIVRQAEPRPLLTLTIKGGASDSLFAQAVGRAISDRVTVVANGSQTQLGINGDFYIESVQHSFGAKQFLETTWELSPADDPESYWILGTSTLGSTTKLAY